MEVLSVFIVLGLVTVSLSMSLEPCRTTCRKKCEFGFLDGDSFPKCTCAPDPCKDKQCEGSTVCTVTRIKDCGYVTCAAVGECVGTELIIDPLSSDPPQKPCTTTCRKRCQFGFLDDDRCPKCTCAPDPCKDKQCEGSTVCTATRNKDCGYVACAAVGECMATGITDPKPENRKKEF